MSDICIDFHFYFLHIYTHQPNLPLDTQLDINYMRTVMHTHTQKRDNKYRALREMFKMFDMRN